jgi:hypothetical protein
MTGHDRSLCPYCLQREQNSGDHVFPQFLGGSATVRTCKECNDKFGHSAEAGLSRDLVPFAITLRKSRMKAPRYAIWRKAVTYDNREWDLDTELVMRPSVPEITKDGSNIISAQYPTKREAKKLATHWTAQGKKSRITEQIAPKLQMNVTSFSLTMGADLKRVAMKMCVAAADFLGINYDLLDLAARRFLLGEIEQSDRIRTDWTIHGSLESLRSPLSHLLYVKGNSSTGRCYGVVQLYGAFQLQVILNKDGYCNPDFACFGSLDPVAGYREHFGMTQLFGIPEAPVMISRHMYMSAIKQWQGKFTAECKAAFGVDDCDVTLDLS